MARIKLYKVGRGQFKVKVKTTRASEGRAGRGRTVRVDQLEQEVVDQLNKVKRAPTPSPTGS